MNTQIDYERLHRYGKVDDRAVAESYVWATNAESKRQGMSSYLIRSIAQRHGGNAHVDLMEQSINIHVPNEKKLACTKELEETIGLSMQ
jgi:hypothetical protein